MEKLAEKSGNKFENLNLEQQDDLWNKIKNEENNTML